MTDSYRAWARAALKKLFHYMFLSYMCSINALKAKGTTRPATIFHAYYTFLAVNFGTKIACNDVLNEVVVCLHSGSHKNAP